MNVKQVENLNVIYFALIYGFQTLTCPCGVQGETVARVKLVENHDAKAQSELDLTRHQPNLSSTWICSVVLLFCFVFVFVFFFFFWYICISNSLEDTMHLKLIFGLISVSLL